MSEKLQPFSPEAWLKPWSVCLVEIMVRESNKGKDMDTKFNLPLREQRPEGEELAVEVEMKINGVPVSFKDSFEELWDRMTSGYDQHVLEKAKELVSGTRLGRLQEIIERFEWELENEVETLYNEQKKG